MEPSNYNRSEKEDSLFGFRLEDVLKSKKSLKWLSIESGESSFVFTSKSDDVS